MLFGKRRPRKWDARRRHGGAPAYRPLGERLETKLLLAIDLGATTPPANPVIAAAPFGMNFAGGPTTGGATTPGAGWSVADVGDVNGDGYDDFLVGAPTVSAPNALGTGAGSEVYLIFGSRTVNVSSITDWIGKNAAGTAFNYTANDRVGDLTQLGSASQTNPITTSKLDFPFSGLAFITSVPNLLPQLGASVSSVLMPSGGRGILIGAPNATASTGQNVGTGRAYLIFGNFNNFVGQTINLDTPSGYSGLNVVTFVNSTSIGGRLGSAVAGGSNILGDGLGDIILGAPLATIDGQTSTGAVYVLSTSFLSGATQTIDVSTLGQSGTNSVVFAGANSGDQAGFSVADGGNVNGVTAGGKNVDDLLIGAPQNGGGTGAAYLIYGGSNLANLSLTPSGSTVRFINLSRVGATTATVPGATIIGPISGGRTGYAVASAGDFNADGFGDILIGEPLASTSTTLTSNGEVSLLYGASSSSTGYLTGTIALSSPKAGIGLATFTGGTTGEMAGYALSLVGIINPGQPNLILIGAPGYLNNQGTAYLIPGRSGLLGTFSLATVQSSPLSGLQFLLSTPTVAATSPAFFGASVSSRFQDTNFTADSDSRQDFIIGAPGYDATQNAARNLAGGAMIIQGGLISVPIPSATQITTQIGVGQPFLSSGATSFGVNATTPANLAIYVFGTTTTSPAFRPVTDINPATVVVNGVAFPNATLNADPNQANWLNGIQDAIITISPRSRLGLNPSVTSLTIKGQTRSTSPLPNQTWTGTAAITVSGSTGPTPPSVGFAVAAAAGPVLETTFLPQFGPTQFTPAISQLSTYNYAPIPLAAGLQPYLPASGFNARMYAFNHPGKHLAHAVIFRGTQPTLVWDRRPILEVFDSNLVNPHKIFDRSRFHAGRSYSWTHKGGTFYTAVVPTQERTQNVRLTPGVNH